MFTGIISAVSNIKNTSARDGSLFLTIGKPRKWRLKPGDSIATDGACLTVKRVFKDSYETELMPETLAKTYFSKQLPKKVNLERPLTLNQFLDGHLVLGHVDGVGKILQIEKSGKSKIYIISYPPAFSKFLVAKGSITVDGISLTVVQNSKHWFTVALVEYTLIHTTLGGKNEKNLVNLEFDIVAKYINSFYARSKKG